MGCRMVGVIRAPVILISVWAVATISNELGVAGVPTTGNQKVSDGTMVRNQHSPLPTPPAGTDPKLRHGAQLQILRDTKIKQHRQWAEGQPCPTGWLHFNDSCYWGSMYPLSWFAAEHECRNFGYDAHLASVHSPDENARVQAMAGCGAPWIGLTKISPSQSSNPTAGWAWTDTSQNDFFAWRSGNPIGTDERNCAYQDKGSAAAGGSRWTNSYCTDLRVFTCKADAKINGEGGGGEGQSGTENEKEKGGSAATEAPEERRRRESGNAVTSKSKPKPERSAKTGDEQSNGAESNSESPVPCPGGAGWLDGKNGFCYFYSSAKANWYEAEARCRNFSAHLLSIKDAVEQRLAMLGGCDKRTWLGAVKWHPEEMWHWYHDMSHVGDGGAFTHWAQNNTGANYIAAYIDTTGNGAGKWYDTPSVHEPMYYICKQSVSGEEGESEGKASGGKVSETGGKENGQNSGSDTEGSEKGEESGREKETGEETKPTSANAGGGHASGNQTENPGNHSNSGSEHGGSDGNATERETAQISYLKTTR